MKRSNRNLRISRIFLGVAVMLVGAILLADRLDLADTRSWWRLWPVLVIGLGVEKVVQSWDTPERGSGGWLVFTGLWLLGVNFHVYGLTYHNSWPLLIIGLGLAMIWKSLFHHRAGHGGRGIARDRHGGDRAGGPGDAMAPARWTPAPRRGTMPAKVSRVYGIHLRSSLFFGVIVVCIGAVFLLDNLHILEADRILPWWPALLIGLGFAKLLDPSLSGTRIGAVIWILAGSLLLASNLDLVPWSIGDLWPVLLILFGAWIAMRGFGLGRPRGDLPEPQAVMNDFAMMAGLTRKNSSKEFRGGEATAIMGGAEIDLSEAELAGGEAVLDLFAMWGGIDIIVPGDWTVENRVTPLLGGVEDSRKTVGKDPAKRLVLRGFAVMGGIEISN